MSKLDEILRDAKKQDVTRIELPDSGIFEIPEEIGELSNLRILNLTNNRITHLPESIGKLNKLFIADWNMIVKMDCS